MEYKSIDNISRRELTINLPKCGDKRNIIENYHIEEMKHEENAYIKIINSPTYESLKIAEKRRKKGERFVGDREAIDKLAIPSQDTRGPLTTQWKEKSMNSIHQKKTPMTL